MASAYCFLEYRKSALNFSSMKSRSGTPSRGASSCKNHYERSTRKIHHINLVFFQIATSSIYFSLAGQTKIRDGGKGSGDLPYSFVCREHLTSESVTSLFKRALVQNTKRLKNQESQILRHWSRLYGRSPDPRLPLRKWVRPTTYTHS